MTSVDVALKPRLQVSRDHRFGSFHACMRLRPSLPHAKRRVPEKARKAQPVSRCGVENSLPCPKPLSTKLDTLDRGTRGWVHLWGADQETHRIAAPRCRQVPPTRPVPSHASVEGLGCKIDQMHPLTAPNHTPRYYPRPLQPRNPKPSTRENSKPRNFKPLNIPKHCRNPSSR